MESLERSRAVIELGKRLITQMKLGDDELTHWMAHLLAERIHNVQTAPFEERIGAQNSCAELVFQLWAHRYSLPPRLRPLKKLEPLLRTLDSLDATHGPRFRFMHEPPADVEVEEDVAKLLGFAVELDDASRILVQYFLAEAAEKASEESKPWIQLAVDAEADATLEVRIISFVSDGLDRSSDEAELARAKLLDKIQKLETFASAAAAHAAELRAKHDLLDDEVTEAQTNGECR
ncbi:MAG: AVAST type 3 anti-phage protein Avs3b [Pseudomonadota bacterium]